MKIRQILESVSAGGMGTSSVATAPSKVGKMQKRQGSLFAEEMGGELKSWQVVIMNNYYRGKYSDYSGRYYYVLASSPEEAKQVVLKNADAILQDLLSMKSINGKKILPRSSAIPITDKRIGDIKDGTEAGRMTTAGYKRMFGPEGVMMVKLSGGAVVDIQGQEQGLAEGASDYVGNAIEDLRASKPGLDRESFLDELYFYIDAQYGKQAADAAFAREDDATFDEWYDSYTDMMEVSMGDYRKKAAMQKAQSQMGAMFARDPAEREKNLATFNKREKGLNRLKARDEKARKAEQDKQLADLVARLPELKAEYERMRAEYKSLGGSDWQYADREQNLSDYERKARSMEGPMNNLWRQIQAAEKAQKEQGLEENKKGVRAVKHTVKPRNFVAKNAIQSGAGAHKDKKKAQKQGDVKHKGKELAYESKLWAALERKISK